MEIVDDEEIGDESPPQAGGGYRDDPWYLEFTEMVRKHREEEADRRQRGMTTWDNKIIRAASSDSEGKNFTFERVRMSLYSEYGSKIFFTMEAEDPADDYSLYVLRTWVKHDKLANTVQSTWEICFCDVIETREADHEWDNEALIDDWYQGEMPKWFSDEDLQHCYVVENSELLMDPNLHLFTEFAFYKKWCQQFEAIDIAGYLPLTIQKVVVETRGEAEIEPSEKLKAANAIFYISFHCACELVIDDEPNYRETNYRAVVQKTMDGKPGHMRL